MSRLSVGEDEFRDAIEEIVRLSPKPGNLYSDGKNDNQPYIIPDFTLDYQNGIFELSLNSSNIPDIKVNRRYVEMIREMATRGGQSTEADREAIPFVKNNEFDYAWFTGGNRVATWILYVLVAIFVVTAVSNGANLTDGLDGLVSGVSAPIVVVLAILAYLSGHIVYADYLNIMYIPGSGELVVFAAAFAGALIGFLWYNSFPAQTFMGDTGSLAIGGIIAVFALCIRKELLLPILCGVFFVESLSVMMQVSYFKYTKRRYGEGRRIFLMSPIHHHYQKKGIFETKIVIRFWIVSMLLSLAALATLKIR